MSNLTLMGVGSIGASVDVSTPTTGILTEADDFIITEASEYLIQE